MYIESLSQLQGSKLHHWTQLLSAVGLQADTDFSQTVLIWEEQQLIAAGSRREALLKCIAVDPAHQGLDLTSLLLTELKKEAFREGYTNLFLYTKPENIQLFTSLFFYPAARTEQVLLLENRRDGLKQFLSSLKPKSSAAAGTVGAIVMNCNPFTLGHRYLIETAADLCDYLYIFVVSEEKSCFSADQRMEMVKLGTADLSRVQVLPTGPYLISSATFPTYFLKNREQAQTIQCALDIQIFAEHFAPHFGITRRFVGSEPLSPLTQSYNRALCAALPAKGITVTEIPRLKLGPDPISASLVRRHLEEGNHEAVRRLVPHTTFAYLTEHGIL